MIKFLNAGNKKASSILISDNIKKPLSQMKWVLKILFANSTHYTIDSKVSCKLRKDIMKKRFYKDSP